LDYRKLQRTWKSKLGADEDNCGDHIYYFMRIQGVSHRIGKVSHSTGSSEKVGDHVMGDTTRRMKVSKSELLKIVDCSISKSQYIDIWQGRS
jgi:hypothetical protein